MTRLFINVNISKGLTHSQLSPLPLAWLGAEMWRHPYLSGTPWRFICMCAARSPRPTAHTSAHMPERGEYFMSCYLFHNIAKLNVQESINLG